MWRRLVFANRFMLSFLLLLLCLTIICRAKEEIINPIPSSCGNIRNISCPFRLKGDDRHPKKSCGHYSLELACQNNRTILNIKRVGYFYVEEINYDNLWVRVVDPGVVLDQKNICSSTPLYSLSRYPYPFCYNCYSYSFPFSYEPFPQITPITFIDCPAPIISTRYIDTASFCSNTNSTNFSSLSPSMQKKHYYSYVVYGNMTVSELQDSCKISKITYISSHRPIIDNASFSDIHDGLVYGFVVSWYDIYCSDCEARSGYCDFFQYTTDFRNYSCSINPSCVFFHSYRPSYQCLRENLRGIRKYLTRKRKVIGKDIGLFFAARFLCGFLCLLALLVYRLKRRHLSVYDSIEDFLRRQNKFMPIRYSYSDIWKITKGFKDKLGEGGFGTVYKGKLRSGRLVAVKMMGKSKATGQEFINEVGTIGRIHHVNVVQLVGFCFEGPKRALMYEFMPNGSLEKYIFPPGEDGEEKGTVSLSYEKMYEISLKVATGIEYIHRGCDMQILHFDIKPHNILLDEKFNPKISDFGLAKLYATDDSIVTLTAARGTMGYMAPELFYKNIGGVLYKADVYSFGMLLMEIAGGRKNLNPFVDHTSQIYFPSWVYDQFSEGKDIQIGDATEKERKVVKKMIIVALWCIQLKPSDRPSMNKVVEMLEGAVELLEMPPKPFLCPQEPTYAEDLVGVNQPPPADQLTKASDDSITQSSN